MSSKITEKKHRLMKANEDFEEILNEDITMVSEAAREWGGRILVIGGALIISYLGVRAIAGKKKKKKSNEEEQVVVKSARLNARNLFLKSLSDKAALVLLALVREYIVKLLKDSSAGDDREDLQ